eukprot:1301195-Prymnesium_polylepis.2
MASSFFLRFVAKEKETTKSSSIISCEGARAGGGSCVERASGQAACATPARHTAEGGPAARAHRERLTRSPRTSRRRRTSSTTRHSSETLRSSPGRCR